MPDLTLTTGQLAALHPVLIALDTLTPPPTPKGRYVLSKAATQVAAEHTAYQKVVLEFLKTVVTRDEKDEPIFTPTDAGGVSFTIAPEKLADYQSGIAGLADEPVTLTGVRQITHAELGACPITVEQERVLIAAGLLEDAEPA